VERIVRINAFGLCALVYVTGVALLLNRLGNQPERSASVKAIKLSIAQMELQAVAAPMPKLRPKPEPEPVPEDEADVALKEVVEKAEPQPQPNFEPPPKAEATVAQVNQEASASAFLVDPDDVQGWVLEEIETEKYYPAAAERFGLTGTFGLTIEVDETGKIQSAEIVDGDGHRILRQALERMLENIIGRKYTKPIGNPMDFEVEFEFE
jgi:TonB family protein